MVKAREKSRIFSNERLRSRMSQVKNKQRTSVLACAVCAEVFVNKALQQLHQCKGPPLDRSNEKENQQSKRRVVDVL